MTNRNLDRVFTISATATIVLSLASAAWSVYTGELGAIVWQCLTAAGFTVALMQSQSKRAYRAEATR